MAYLELDRIGKQFGTQTVVDEFSLAVGKGEFTKLAPDIDRLFAGDSIEAELLYDLLEREVVPLFFRRDKTDRGLARSVLARRAKTESQGFSPDDT